jgi:hypothetical protein
MTHIHWALLPDKDILSTVSTIRDEDLDCEYCALALWLALRSC